MHDFDLLAKFMAINAITISQEIFRCCVKGKGFDDLLSGPFRRWMSGNVEVEDAPPVMRKYDKHKQNFEPNARHGKEVDRSQLGNVIRQKCSPCLRWRLWMADHVLRDRGF